MTGLENQSQSWIVKSSGRILGPYNLDQLIIELKEKRISIIDEVRSPDKRWGFIREYQQFSEVVQYLRDQQSKTKEDTGSIYATKTLTDSGGNDDLTPTPILRQEIRYEPPIKKVEAQEKVVRTTPSDRTYASSMDPAIQKSISAQKKTYAQLAWGILFLVVVILGISFVQMRRDSPKSLGYDDYLKLAKYNKSIGMFEKSLQFYKKADAVKSLDVTSKLQMAPLLMVVENQNVVARQILEKVKAAIAAEPNLINEIDLYIAISYLREGDLERAENGMIQILGRDPNNPYVQINRNIVRMMKGEYLGAYYEISSLIEKGLKEPMLLVLKALAAYQAFDVIDNRARMESSVQDLLRYAKKNKDYYPESMLLIAGFEKKLGNNLEVIGTLNTLLNNSPTITQEHIHSLQIDRQVLAWDYLYKVCQDLQQGPQAAAVVQALMAYCHYQRNEMGPAIDIYQKLRNQYSKEHVLFAFHSFLLFQLGRFDEANAVLKQPKAMESNLALEVAGLSCMNEKDWACAEKRWNEILQADPMNLKAITGLATIAYEKGQKELAADMLKRGLMISESYRPLVELKDQIDAL